MLIDLEVLSSLAEPEAVAVLALLPDLSADVGALGLQRQGAAALALVGDLPVPASVMLHVEEDGTRVFTPSEPTTDTVVLWIHGGGLIGGEPRQDDSLCGGIAHDHGVTVRACTYRLAPQHPYPSGLEDCVTALEAALERHPFVVLAGASAGGGLAISTALLARDRGITGVRGVVAYYPMLDDRPGRTSMERFVAPKTWHAELDRLAWAAYLADLAEIPFYAAPARATAEQLRGLPPVYLDVGSLDGFLDEDLAFAESLARADVPVDLSVVPLAWHASEILAPDAPSSRRLTAARRSAIARMLADD